MKENGLWSLTSRNFTKGSNSRTLSRGLDMILTALSCPLSSSLWHHTAPKGPEPSCCSVLHVCTSGVWTTVAPSVKTEASLYRESVLLPAAMGDGVNSWVGGCGNPALAQGGNPVYFLTRGHVPSRFGHHVEKLGGFFPLKYNT